MTLHREYDAKRLNIIANAPSVKPWIALKAQQGAPLDSSALVADLRNVLLCVEGGALLFHWQEPGLYEVHIQFLPEVRGRAALAAVRGALEWMFIRTDAMEIHTKVPANNEAARLMVQAIHGKLMFGRPEAWDEHSVDYYALRYEDWLWDQAEHLEARGKWFHQRLDAEMARLGVADDEAHGDDAAHDRAVGATVDMILAGQLDKAIVLYNRWARLAGYAMVTVMCQAPPIVNIGNATVLVSDGTFHLLGV